MTLLRNLLIITSLFWRGLLSAAGVAAQLRSPDYAPSLRLGSENNTLPKNGNLLSAGSLGYSKYKNIAFLNLSKDVICFYTNIYPIWGIYYQDTIPMAMNFSLRAGIFHFPSWYTKYRS
jgi:hypothetical protein